jgi:hypothetical protein
MFWVYFYPSESLAKSQQIVYYVFLKKATTYFAKETCKSASVKVLSGCFIRKSQEQKQTSSSKAAIKIALWVSNYQPAVGVHSLKCASGSSTWIFTFMQDAYEENLIPIRQTLCKISSRVAWKVIQTYCNMNQCRCTCFL